MSAEDPPEAPKRRWTGKPKSGAGGERQMFTRVKNKKFDESSRNWMKRHLNDPYVAKARADGFRARAAYKLTELNDEFHFLKRGMRVIDLGAAPGGWAQVAVQRGASAVIGVDLLPIEPLTGATFFELDLLDEKTPAVLLPKGGFYQQTVGNWAFRLSPDGTRAQRVAIRLGRQNPDYYEVLAGLRPGDRVVTSSYEGYADRQELALDGSQP